MRQVCFGRPDSSSFVERVPQAVAGARGGQWPADPVPGQWPQASRSSWSCHPPGSPQDPPRIPAPHRPVPCARGRSRRGWAQAGPGRTQNSLEFSPFRHLQSNTTGNNLGTLLEETSCGMLFPSIPGDHPDLPLDLHWVKPVCPITGTLLLGQHTSRSCCSPETQKHLPPQARESGGEGWLGQKLLPCPRAPAVLDVQKAAAGEQIPGEERGNTRQRVFQISHREHLSLKQTHKRTEDIHQHETMEEEEEMLTLTALFFSPGKTNVRF